MAKGVALTIGLNSVDPGHYQGWSGDLVACEADARDMAQIAKSRGFTVNALLTKAATRGAVAQAIQSQAQSLVAGDVFMLSYSGHGGQLPDLNDDEDDGQDETWCLFDGELVDDELYAALAHFASGVRVLVFSDSCHSGTSVKLAFYAASGDRSHSARVARGFSGGDGETRYRAMPAAIALRTYQANQALYDPILQDQELRAAVDKVKASVLLISGCQDNQLSADGTFNGLFTGTLKQVWNGGKFKGGYRSFRRKIVNRMPPDQTPNYFTVGARNAPFEGQRPFTI
jgi:metacaspase-1